MAPNKKDSKTMSAADFLKDESYGESISWADDCDGLPAITSGGYSRRDFSADTGGFINTFRSGDRDAYRPADGREDRYSSRQQIPLPEKPPYTARVSNLSWTTTEGDIQEHFTGCEVVNVRLIRDRIEDRPKGYGFVEYATLDGLVKALGFDGTQLGGRPVRIGVAEPHKGGLDDRTTHEWRRTGPLSPLEPPRGGRTDKYGDASDRPERRSFDPAGDGKVRDLGNWERKGPLAPLSPSPTTEGSPREVRRRSPSDRTDRPEGTPRREYRERPPVERQPTAAERDNEWRKNARPDPPPMRERSIPTSPVVPQTRPKLELKKRSEGLPEPTTAMAETPITKSNPFGEAKPIDAEARLREVEERRAALKREQEEKVKKEAEERQAKEEAGRLAMVQEPEKVENPEAENPEAKKPEAENPEAERPEAERPEAENPEAEKPEAEKLEAEKPEAEKLEAEKPEAEYTEKPVKTERTLTSPREPREHRGFGGSGYRGDRGDRNDRGDRHDRHDRGDRHDRFERGGDRADKGHRPLPGGGREWRRAPEHPHSQGRRESRQETKSEGTTATVPAKVEPAEDGWSTVRTKKGRGGSKVATMT